MIAILSSAPAFLNVLRASGIRLLAFHREVRNLNSFAERWAGAITKECLSKLILVGEASLAWFLDHTRFKSSHPHQHSECDRSPQTLALGSKLAQEVMGYRKTTRARQSQHERNRRRDRSLPARSQGHRWTHPTICVVNRYQRHRRSLACRAGYQPAAAAV